MAETTVVACPTCGKKFRVGADKIGRTFKCTGCQNRFVASNQPAAPPVEPVVEVEETAAETTAAAAPVPQTPDPAAYPAGDAGLPPKTSGMAIASLVCGILFCIPLASLLALIFGIVGIKQTKNNQASGRGMAIAGTVLGSIGTLLYLIWVGLVVTLGMSVMSAIPQVGQAIETANRAKCASNMHLIGVALIQYQSTYGANPPDLATLWKNEPQLTGAVFVCPSSNDTPAASPSQLTSGGHLSYVYIGANVAPNSTAPILYENSTDHPKQGTNILFEDGSVKWRTVAEAQGIIPAAP